MYPNFAGALRFFCAALVWLLFSVPAWATIHWEKLPDRERLSMTFGITEGMAGPVGRIALTGVAVPFTRVPSGVRMEKTPDGAALVKNTHIMGQTLVIETLTPEFGFMVSRQTSTEVVIDFFSNPLGARWRPTEIAPTTELPPEHLVRPPEQHDVATKALAVEPQGTGPKTAAALAPPAPAAQVPPPIQPQAVPPVQATPAVVQPQVLTGVPEPAQTAPSTPAAPSAEAVPPAPSTPAPAQAAPAAQAEDAFAGQRPVVVTLSGTPEHATAATQMAEAPPVAVPVRPPQSGAGSTTVAPSGDAVVADVNIGPLLEAIEEKDKQTAPLPTPPLPLPVSDAIRSSDIGAGVGVRVSPGFYTGVINTGGFEDIGRSTETVQGGTPPGAHEAQPLFPTTQPVTVPAEPEQAAPVIVYVDAEGKEIPPPPSHAALMPEIYEHIRQGAFAQALEKATQLLTRGLIDRDLREELLHIRAEMLFLLGRNNLSERYLEIADATNQAMNFNRDSPRNAGALLRLGYLNLQVHNIAEAEAHFNMLRRQFPNDENVPLTYYYWGEFHFGRNEMQRAADEFQYILQEYPNSRFARDAALGLARAFYRLGYFEQAFDVVDYIERRWARFYLDYPPFLNMIGDVAFRLNRLDDALRHYWTYMNLQPFGEEADIILTRLGDIYAMRRERAAARSLYTVSIERFPGRDGALVAMMRLAEDGMHDTPSIAGMFSVFDGPFSQQPVEIYRTIINRYPDSALVPLAEVKLALWYLWDRQYEQTLDTLSAFLDRYPHHELTPRVREIMLQTFSLVATDSMQNQRFGKMRELWERHEGVRGQAESLAPESRMALAVSYRHNDRPNEALEVLEPLFYGTKIPEYSEMALSLVLSIYLEYEQWQSIFDVARRIDLWELTPEIQMQLDYAMALAGENLGNIALSTPLWQRLYDSGRLPPAQMAYATFFLARAAERNRELERAFFLGSEALSRLLVQVEQSPNAADVGRIQTQLASLMDVAETAGRLREALAFADQYLQYLGANDPERMAVRYRMARIYKKQGDDDSWQKALTEIVAQDPGSVFGQLAASELNAASLAREAAQFSPTGRI